MPAAPVPGKLGTDWFLLTPTPASQPEQATNPSSPSHSLQRRMLLFFFFPLLFPHPSAKIKKKKKKKPLGTEREGRGRGNTANSRPQNFVESTNVGETLPPESQCERLRLQQLQHRTGDSGASERAETPPNKQKRRPLHRAAIAAHCRGAEERSFPGVSLCLPSSGSGAVYPTPRTLRTETKPSRAPLPTPRSGAAKPRVARLRASERKQTESTRNEGGSLLLS